MEVLKSGIDRLFDTGTDEAPKSKVISKKTAKIAVNDLLLSSIRADAVRE